MEPGRRPLTLPTVDHADYEKNFVRTVVCELRFPALLEFETHAPDSLQKALRKAYPHYQKTQNMVALPLGGEVQQRYLFRSKDQKWTVAFHSSAVVLETTAYVGFDDFSEKLRVLLKAVEPTIDADFFTRIGLRYINVLPYGGPDDFSGWVNPDLVKPLVNGPYGDLTIFSQEIHGLAERGTFLFRHGLGIAGEKREYVLDFDFADESIETKDALSLVKELHDSSYRFFRWAIGPKAIAAMGKDRRSKHE